MSRTLRSLVAASIACISGTALSDPSATVTGDWSGARSRLSDAGLDLSLGYTSEAATNVQGGARHDATETGQFTLGATADTGKLFGLEGGTFQASLTYRRGKNLVQRAGLGTLLQVQEVYGRGQTWRVTELWYQQQIGGGVDVKIGRLPVGGDFSSFSCDYMNGAFCGAPVGNIAGDFWYNWPVSQWAGRIRVQHGAWYAMAGAYEVNPRNLDNDFFVGHFHGATGVLAPFEAGVRTRVGSHGLPGLYRIGGWYSSANADDVLLGADRRPATLAGTPMLQRSGRYGGFVMLQQQLSGRYRIDPRTGPQTTHGLTAFLTVTQTDRDTERVDNQITAGLRYLGALPGRPADSIQLGFARSHVNHRAAVNEVDREGGALLRSEYEIELDYAAQLLGYLTMEPNLQYVVHPGGDDKRRDVIVLGAKTAISF